MHIDSHSAMTGASRFLHPSETPSPWFLPPSSPGWSYNKSESLPTPGDFDSFDYLVTGHPAVHRAAFDVVDAVAGFQRFRRAGLQGLAAVFEDSVWVMMRRKDR